MKYRLIRYNNGTFGLHEMHDEPYERATSVGDSAEEIIEDVQNMLEGARGEVSPEPESYKKMEEL